MICDWAVLAMVSSDWWTLLICDWAVGISVCTSTICFQPGFTLQWWVKSSETAFIIHITVGCDVNPYAVSEYLLMSAQKVVRYVISLFYWKLPIWSKKWPNLETKSLSWQHINCYSKWDAFNSLYNNWSYYKLAQGRGLLVNQHGR